ncbi:MAG TPA: hypothetical protein VNU68_34735 [Verrucomicrobiae bacterium]|nr:hypothetical protein [Verrucomicrobiae bacterium]
MSEKPKQIMDYQLGCAGIIVLTFAIWIGWRFSARPWQDHKLNDRIAALEHRVSLVETNGVLYWHTNGLMLTNVVVIQDAVGKWRVQWPTNSANSTNVILRTDP